MPTLHTQKMCATPVYPTTCLNPTAWNFPGSPIGLPGGGRHQNRVHNCAWSSPAFPGLLRFLVHFLRCGGVWDRLYSSQMPPCGWGALKDKIHMGGFWPPVCFLSFKAPQPQRRARNEQGGPQTPSHSRGWMKKSKNAAGIAKKRFSASWQCRRSLGATMHPISTAPTPRESNGTPWKVSGCRIRASGRIHQRCTHFLRVQRRQLYYMYCRPFRYIIYYIVYNMCQEHVVLVVGWWKFLL